MAGETKKTETSAPAIPEAPEAGPMVYLGPTLTGKLPASVNTIFAVLPPYLAQAMAQDPELSLLIVPVDQVGRARQELRDPQSPMSRAARMVARRYAKQNMGKE